MKAVKAYFPSFLSSHLIREKEFTTAERTERNYLITGQALWRSAPKTLQNYFYVFFIFVLHRFQFCWSMDSRNNSIKFFGPLLYLVINLFQIIHFSKKCKMIKNYPKDEKVISKRRKIVLLIASTMSMALPEAEKKETSGTER